MGRSRSRTRSPARSQRAPAPSRNGHRHKKHNSHQRGYSQPGDRTPQTQSVTRKSEVTILLCIYNSMRHNWSTAPVKFNLNRTNDRELWFDIRDTFRMDLQGPFARWFSFRHVTSIVPIAFSPNGTPLRTDPKNFPQAQQFRHAYHHPQDLQPAREWVDWFADFDANDTRQNGLEFVEGLWTDKLAALAILFTIGIVVACIVWCVLGGGLQTVFTVMSFVLTLVAAQIALVALYFQVGQSDTGSS